MEPYPELINVYHLPEMQDRHRVFHDRAHAGKVLSSMLGGLRDKNPLILGIPAGGVPVASVIADRLDLNFDLAVVSKITLPWDTEAGYGAVAFDGTTRLNHALTERLRLDPDTIEEGIHQTTQKVNRRRTALRGEEPFPELSGRSVILVDDGLASGFTMLVALEAVSKNRAAEVFVAVPTGLLRSIERLAPETRGVFCPNVRSAAVFAVADAYENWRDVSEAEVRRLLEKDSGYPGRF